MFLAESGGLAEGVTAAEEGVRALVVRHVAFAEKGKRYIFVWTKLIKPENKEKADKEFTKLSEKEIEVVGKLPLKELESIKSETPYFTVFELIEK